MKLTTLLSGFLTAFALASAIPTVLVDITNSTSLATLYKRGPDDTPAFNAFDKVKSGMVTGKQYVFTATYALPEKIDPNPKIAAAQRELGFCHISVIVIEISSKLTGPKGKQKTVRDLKGDNSRFYHLIKKENGDTASEFKNFDFGKSEKMQLKFVKETKTTHQQRKATGEAYVAGHKKYDAKTANCNTYQEDFVKSL